ncbi:HIT family protein [Serinibacter salmoneus]|uniref:Diadenosine tetraphosphate (Ap4A) HIT family hydrolase n=1 Tax=Serinibacter salmoneus TaxID=556530 RepID=A0A2A9D138_9MICO|nr:HIT family protein [Serinibacter salmoneus]PFG19569.1 diadenosine tetraphosphate (Ap4A) HIT family hydrolase [Serinibacter salmoneus]
MATLFTQIIAGEIPGQIIHSDPECVVFLTIAPVTPGHALVVPRAEIDHWIEADPDLLAHLTAVAQRIGRAQLTAFGGNRIGLVVQGYGVPHLHLHVFPTTGPEDFRHIEGEQASPDQLAQAADRLRAALAHLP